MNLRFQPGLVDQMGAPVGSRRPFPLLCRMVGVLILARGTLMVSGRVIRGTGACLGAHAPMLRVRLSGFNHAPPVSFRAGGLSNQL